MSGYPEKYAAMIDQLDGVWQGADAALRAIRDLKPASIKDAVQVGKAIAAASVAVSAAKDAASVLGRTSPTLWQ